MNMIKMMTFAFVTFFSTLAMAALEPTVIPAGTFHVADQPANEESYCNRTAAENRECVPLARTKNGTWIAYWYPGGNGCESGSVGYLNTKTMMDYPITTEADCTVPELDITFEDEGSAAPGFAVWAGEDRVSSGRLR